MERLNNNRKCTKLSEEIGGWPNGIEYTADEAANLVLEHERFVRYKFASTRARVRRLQ